MWRFCIGTENLWYKSAVTEASIGIIGVLQTKSGKRGLGICSGSKSGLGGVLPEPDVEKVLEFISQKFSVAEVGHSLDCERMGILYEASHVDSDLKTGQAEVSHYRGGGGLQAVADPGSSGTGGGGDCQVTSLSWGGGGCCRSILSAARPALAHATENLLRTGGADRSLFIG